MSPTPATTAAAASQEAAASGLTGAMQGVDKIREGWDRMQSENVDLKAHNAQLVDDLAAAERDRDEAQARAEEAQTRAESLAEALDSGLEPEPGEPVEAEPGEIRAGALVVYRLLDVVTGVTLSGPAVVVRAGEGGLVVAPISPLPLTLTPEAVTAVPAQALEG